MMTTYTLTEAELVQAVNAWVKQQKNIDGNLSVTITSHENDRGAGRSYSATASMQDPK